MPEPSNSDPVLHALKLAAARQLAPPRSLPERASLAQDAPAPALSIAIAEHGPKAIADALRAWDMRLSGQPITDVAHEFGLSIEAAKHLIKEAHSAIAEDLKDNLEINRQLDLARIDGLLQTFYPAAKAGDDKAAQITLKCIERRSKLTGTEPEGPPRGNEPRNVLVWVQQQLPQINRIVDSLPVELAPGVPG